MEETKYLKVRMVSAEEYQAEMNARTARLWDLCGQIAKTPWDDIPALLARELHGVPDAERDEAEKRGPKE